SLGVRVADWKIEVLGTDISEKMLMTAQKAIYGEYALQAVHPIVLQRYFKKLGVQQYELDPTIKSMVRFELLNLKESFAARRFGIFDVIFCRNVLIYFDDAMKNH